MKPEKLYIPTSTLNFNNIMSNESISPARFYRERGFGHKRFEKVEPNGSDHLITLYDSYFPFEIDDKERDEYQMTIEIENIPEDIINCTKNAGIYYYGKTIYLNKSTTRIIFRTEKEKTDTLSKSEPSIEAKMVILYCDRCITEKQLNKDEVKTFENICKQKRSEPVANNDDIQECISHDRRINRLKGFFICLFSSCREIIA